MTSNDFVYPEDSLWNMLLQNICFPDFPVKMVKQENFLHVVDLLFDERFVKYYHFSLPYCKTVATNNIKIEFLQFDQQVSDVFEHAPHR